MKIDRTPAVVSACLVLAALVNGLRAQGTEPEAVRFFGETVRPILENRCWKCHGAAPRIKGGLRLTHRDHIVRGGDLGPAVDLKAPGSSLLLRMISYSDEQHQMPPEAKLPQREIDALTRWVKDGIPWTPGEEPAPAEEDAPKRLTRGDGREGWSYQPLQRPEPPAVENDGWVRTPVDAFVLAPLEHEGLSPAPAADRAAFIRRATYDLTGLPPTPEEVDTFLADERADAVARLVDRLLASPRYGEKWGRHWLDLVRYGETNGYERDTNKPFIWRYRDYVIESFNDDKPYDRFLTEQLAGDELDEVNHESLIATGFYRLMIWDDEPGAGRLQARYDVLDDIVSVTGQAFMGMTLGCARCHDHKGDPVSQTEYYEFMSWFHGITDMSVNGYLTPIMNADERAEHDAAVERKKRDEAQALARVRQMEDTFLQRLRQKDEETRAGRASDLADLRYRFYRDTWNELPDFDALRPEDEGEVPGGLVDLGVATRRDAIGLVFEGQLVVPEPGEYRFSVRTHRGVRLRIADRDVITPRTKRDRRVASGTVTLQSRSVPFRLDYFNKNGDAGLEVWWEPADAAKWLYTVKRPADTWMDSAFGALDWAQGRAGFGTAGTPEAEVRTTWNTSDIWLRRTFHWDGKRPEEMVLIAHHDEDLAVYVNGVRAVTATGYRSDYGVFELNDAGRSALRTGSNVLAVHCNQTGGGQYVHVVPARRSELAGRSLSSLAFGRRYLTPDGSVVGGEELKRLIDRRGAELLTKDEQERLKKLRQELQRVRRRQVPRKVAATVQEKGSKVGDLHVHVRGNPHTRGEKVEPGTPTILGVAPPDPPKPPRGGRSSGRRRALAEWLTRPDHPLTARVMANRVWQHHFGRGIVRSSNDFGELGERPTHPKLLDWLANELIRDGWRLKSLHRIIMLSSTYGMAVVGDDVAAEADPRNDLLWRFDLRRLAAEEIRDSILAVSGRLNPKMGGPGFFSMIPKEVLATSSRPDAAWGRSKQQETWRRSVYIKVKRSLVTPILAGFDLADTDTSCPARFNTTQPTQSLSLLNGEFTNRHVVAFAERLRREAGDNPEDQIRLGLRLVCGREPGAGEVTDHLAFLEELRNDYGQSPQAALERLCLVLVNLNAFLYVE